MRIRFKLICERSIELPPPTVDIYYKIYYPASEQEKIEGVIDWLGSGRLEDRAIIQAEDIPKAEVFLNVWLKQKRSEEQYTPPHIATDTEDNSVYKTEFHEMKFVSDYTNMNFQELRGLDVLTFWRYYRDAIIYKGIQSEHGKEFLNNAYNSVQTKPDRLAIAELIQSQA